MFRDFFQLFPTSTIDYLIRVLRSANSDEPPASLYKIIAGVYEPDATDDNYIIELSYGDAVEGDSSADGRYLVILTNEIHEENRRYEIWDMWKNDYVAEYPASDSTQRLIWLPMD